MIIKNKIVLIIVALIYCSTYAHVTFTPEISMDNHEARSIMFQMGNSFLLSQALAAAARLGIADQLTECPKTAAQLAHNLEIHEQSLFRLMRMLTSYTIFTMDTKHRFALTHLGELLVTDNPHSLRYFLMMDDYARWSAYANLDKAIKTGKTAFELTHNKNYFDFIQGNSESQALFNQGMLNISAQESELIASTLDINTQEETSLVDIGGGNGGLLLSIKKKYPNLNQAIVFDYTQLDQATEQKLILEGIEYARGSFFDADTIPKDKTTYILKRVLHDWSDSECLTILQNCVRAMTPGNRLLIIETVIEDNNNYHIGKDIDIVMLALFGGKERSIEEFKALFSHAGLEVISRQPIDGSMLSIIELRISQSL